MTVKKGYLRGRKSSIDIIKYIFIANSRGTLRFCIEIADVSSNAKFLDTPLDVKINSRDSGLWPEKQFNKIEGELYNLKYEI